MNNGKYKILLIIIIVLLLANMVTLYFLMKDKRRKNGGRGEAFTEYLKKNIGFSDKQMKNYDSLLQEHRNAMKLDFSKTDSLRRYALKTVAENQFTDSAIVRSVENNSVFFKDMQIQMLQHLRAIRNICTAEQQNIFDTSFYKVIFKSKKNNK